MEEVIKALWALYNAGFSWRQIGLPLGITGQYVMMIAKGERPLRERNPLRKRILNLKLVPKGIQPEPVVKMEIREVA